MCGRCPVGGVGLAGGGTSEMGGRWWMVASTALKLEVRKMVWGRGEGAGERWTRGRVSDVGVGYEGKRWKVEGARLTIGGKLWSEEERGRVECRGEGDARR